LGQEWGGRRKDALEMGCRRAGVEGRRKDALEIHDFSRTRVGRRGAINGIG
jgi:hypothetical protein